MQIRSANKQEREYKEEVILTFQSQKEADAFFSLFNVTKITDAFENLTGKPCRLYDGAGAAGASAHRFFHQWCEILK